MYLQPINNKGFVLKVWNTLCRNLSPPDVFKEATDKFSGQASLDADGAIIGYTAGRPFDPTGFKAGTGKTVSNQCGIITFDGNMMVLKSRKGLGKKEREEPRQASDNENLAGSILPRWWRIRANT